MTIKEQRQLWVVESFDQNGQSVDLYMKSSIEKCQLMFYSHCKICTKYFS